MKPIVYIGRFTPATGGVTAKNSAIFAALDKKIDIQKIDLTAIKKGNVKVLILTLLALFRRSGKLVIGTAGQMRRVLSHVLYIFNRKVMRNSVLVVMGGQFSGIILKDKSYEKWVREYKTVLVETERMKRDLNSIGMTNVDIFPNCRKKPESEIAVRPRDGRLKCVCFSMIYPEKGIDTALEAAKALPGVDFDFWGDINPDYKDEFLNGVEALPNCRYNGIYKVDGENVYHMLNSYDLLLFPTRMAGEGVPGTLIEAKIAALPAAVTDIAHNAELVEDGVSGLVLKENSVGGLVEAIKAVDKDDALLAKLKNGAKKSGENFYFEAYIDKTASYLQ